MNVVKWECPGYPGNDQVFPCPYFEVHGFSVRGDFHTDVWPEWATVPFQWWTAACAHIPARRCAPFTCFFTHIWHSLPEHERVRTVQPPWCCNVLPCCACSNRGVDARRHSDSRHPGRCCFFCSGWSGCDGLQAAEVRAACQAGRSASNPHAAARIAKEIIGLGVTRGPGSLLVYSIEMPRPDATKRRSFGGGTCCAAIYSPCTLTDTPLFISVGMLMHI